MGQRRAVRTIELPGHAPLVAAERRRAAGKLDRGLIEIGDPAVGIRGVDGGGNGRQQFLQALLAFPEFSLGNAALGDVAGDFRGADDPA